MKLVTYCLACREHTDKVGSKEVTLANKISRENSRCSECFSGKSRFLKQKHNKKDGR